jgi:hypothetical protein
MFRNVNEWDKLAKWVINHNLLSHNVRLRRRKLTCHRSTDAIQSSGTCSARDPQSVLTDQRGPFHTKRRTKRQRVGQVGKMGHQSHLLSHNVRWLIQIPRLYEVYKGAKQVDTFADIVKSKNAWCLLLTLSNPTTRCRNTCNSGWEDGS